MTDFELKTTEYESSYPEIEIRARIIVPRLDRSLDGVDLRALKERVLGAIYDAYTTYSPTTPGPQKEEV